MVAEDSPTEWNSGDDADEVEDIFREDKERLEQLAVFEPFRDLFKRRFLWYCEHYMLTVEENMPKHKDGSPFEKMPFEAGGNTMDGKFGYSDLGKRLARIKEALNEETAKWATEGLEMKKRESTKASNLQRQYEQLSEHLRQKHIYNFSIELEDDNPFLWIITYFGKPMTHLDGGIFKIRMAVSPRFPQEQPRVKVETRIYHHRVSKDGILCYFPKKVEEMQNHVETIIEALEEESPPFDPRTIVHPEATKLLWGTDAEKKKYYRQLRRSAQSSVDDG